MSFSCVKPFMAHLTPGIKFQILVMSYKTLSNLDLPYTNLTSYRRPADSWLTTTTLGLASISWFWQISFSPLGFVPDSFLCSHPTLFPRFWMASWFSTQVATFITYSKRLFLNTLFKMVSPCCLMFVCF